MTRVDRRTRALVAALLVAAAGAAAGFRPAGGPVAMGLEEIKARIAEQRKKVPGLRVEYRLKYEPMVEEKLLARWGVAYALANRAEEAAFKGDKTYWHVVQKKEIRGFGSPYEPDPESPPSVQERARRRAEDHLKALRDAGQPDALPRGPVTIKPQELIWAFDGKSYWRREPLSPFPTPVIVETGDSADPAWRNGQFQAPYFEDVGLLFPFGVAAGAASGSHRARLLPSALDAHAYAVSPRSEPVDGGLPRPGGALVGPREQGRGRRPDLARRPAGPRRAQARDEARRDAQGPRPQQESRGGRAGILAPEGMRAPDRDAGRCAAGVSRPAGPLPGHQGLQDRPRGRGRALRGGAREQPGAEGRGPVTPRRLCEGRRP